MTDIATHTAVPAADLYREVHKGLRRALFELVDRAGSLDATDSTAIDSFRARFADVDMMLHTHHGHEDGPALAALISQHAGDLVAGIEASHDRIEQQLVELRANVAGLDGAHAAAALYDDLTTFTADYLAHMQVEEQQVMPLLQAGATTDELMEITMVIRTSVPPPEMCVFLRSMLPAMNPDERTAMLGGMKMGAPPEIFELFWGVAEENLSADDLATVAGRLDISAVAS